MKWIEWVKVFLTEWEKVAGYKLIPDELSEEHWRIDYFDEGLSPEKAVEEEIRGE